MLDVLEQQQRLTKNQWKIISAAVLGDMLDFFLVGRFAWAYLSDAIGRRPSGILLSFGGAVTLVIAGLFHDVFLGGMSVFSLMLMAQRFFGDGGYALVGLDRNELTT